MVLENIQGSLYFLTLLLAVFTAVLGILVINSLFMNKIKELFNNTTLFIFFFLVFGYVCFAAAELCWYLMFEVFGSIPAVSMPDFYWVIGSISLLAAFITFSVHMYRQHGRPSEILFISVFGAVVLSVILYYLSSLDFLTTGATTGHIFLGFFYPLASSLILVSSVSAYLFQEAMDTFRSNMLLLFLANAAFLVGDLLYIYYFISETYGLVGVLSDSFYIIAYGLCSLSFFSLLVKVFARRRKNPSGEPLKF